MHYPKYKKLLKTGNSNYWRKKYEELAVKYPINESEYCGYLEFIDIYWGIFPTKWFEEYEDVIFEGHTFRAIKERDKFLTLRYDDYMKLPPENERVTHHPYDFYYRN